MSKRWFQENRRDPWRREARSKGYRARSAYKLKQIQDKFRIMRKGDAVLDVGCHPGGWTQVVVEEVGFDGLVVGVDLLATSPVEGASIIIGDIGNTSTIDQISEILDGRTLNAVVSDISPKLTGRYDTDQAISLELSTLVMDTAMIILAPGGNFVTKIFQGTGIEGLMEAAKQRFSNVQRYAPTASRKASSETYLVCQNKLPWSKNKTNGVTAFQQVQQHLEKINVLVKNSEEDNIETKIGFKKMSKKKE
ncbi:RlmE family RNA methyltransferase [Euryarchaeota archaeon]|nr:RlmE family RNA methyltransferase [Euryarchaeota archaeon]|tara:strand:+ start:11883 stop:12632 length:750 start_codon:yes stop_codon:yes gene_type:complete